MYPKMRSLRVGQKYTIVGFTYTGLPYDAQMILRDIKCKDYEHGADSYELLYKKIDTKALICMKIAVNKQFIIWDGIVYPNAQPSAISYPDPENPHAVIHKRWRPNDPRYMHRALNSVVQKPLVENVRPLPIDDSVYDLCTSVHVPIPSFNNL